MTKKGMEETPPSASTDPGDSIADEGFANSVRVRACWV